MPTLTAPNPPTTDTVEEVREQGPVATGAGSKVLAMVVMAAIIISLIGLGVTVSAGATLATLSTAAVGFGVLGTLSVLAAVVLGFLALART